MFHIASAPHSALAGPHYTEKVLQQYQWQMLIAAFTLKVCLLSPTFFFFFKIICMQYITLTLRLYQKVLLGPGTREHNPREVLVIKLDSYISDQALTASIGENTVFTNIVFTETAATADTMIKPFSETWLCKFPWPDRGCSNKGSW